MPIRDACEVIDMLEGVGRHDWVRGCGAERFLRRRGCGSEADRAA